MPAPRAWIFDLDGTLVDTLPELLGALNAALADHGQPAVTSAVAKASLSAGIDAMVDAAARRTGADAGALAAAFERRYAERLARGSQPYPGARALLAGLASRGVPLAVCTNRTEALAHRLLESTALARHLRVVVGADTCGRRKPDPEPLRLALAYLEAEPGEAVLVGDSDADADCAAATGVPFWFHVRGYGPAAAARKAAHVFADWESLGALAT